MTLVLCSSSLLNFSRSCWRCTLDLFQQARFSSVLLQTCKIWSKFLSLGCIADQNLSHSPMHTHSHLYRWRFQACRKNSWKGAAMRTKRWIQHLNIVTYWRYHLMSLSLTAVKTDNIKQQAEWRAPEWGITYFPTAEIESAIASLTFFSYMGFLHIFLYTSICKVIDREPLSDCAHWAQTFLWYHSLPKIKSIRF